MNTDFVYITSGSGNMLNVFSASEEKVKNFLEENPDEKILYYELFGDAEKAEERFNNIRQWNARKMEAVLDLFNPERKDCRYEII